MAPPSHSRGHGLVLGLSALVILAVCVVVPHLVPTSGRQHVMASAAGSRDTAPPYPSVMPLPASFANTPAAEEASTGAASRSGEPRGGVVSVDPTPGAIDVVLHAADATSSTDGTGCHEAVVSTVRRLAQRLRQGVEPGHTLPYLRVRYGPKRPSSVVSFPPPSGSLHTVR